MPLAAPMQSNLLVFFLSKFNFYTTNLRFISWADWIIFFFFFHHYNEKCYLLKSVSALSRDCLLRLSLLILIDRLSDNVSNDRNQSKSFSVGYIISSRREKKQIKSNQMMALKIKSKQLNKWLRTDSVCEKMEYNQRKKSWKKYSQPVFIGLSISFTKPISLYFVNGSAIFF